MRRGKAKPYAKQEAVKVETEGGRSKRPEMKEE